MIKIIPLMAALSVLPVAAATTDVCREPVEDNEAAATVQEDPATARILERHRTDPYFTLDAVAKELRSADGDVPDEVIGHLLWAIRTNKGNKAEFYYLLRALGTGGRADVADQFLEGLHDSDAKVRSAAEHGLSSAPLSRRTAGPLERVASAGAVEALTIYAGKNFPEMDPTRRDVLRDLLRDYGIELLAQDDTVEKAKRDTAVREAVAYLFVPVIGGRRPTDVTTISATLEAAVRVEPPGTRVEEMFSSLQTLLATAPRRNTR